MKTKTSPALDRALRATRNLGAPGTGMEFIRALDALLPPEVSPEHGPCPKCGRETHRSNLAKYGSCVRCR